MFKTKIGVDYDSVLAYCCSYAIELANKEYHFDPPLALEEITSWGRRNTRTDIIFKYFDQEDFFENQPIIPGAKEFLRKLTEIADVYIITAVDPRFMGIRINRILKDFPMIPKENIIMGYNKSLINVDILLDDNPLNILKSTCKHPVIFRRPWNERLTGMLSVSTYEEFISLVKCLQNIDHKRQPPRKTDFFVLIGPSGSGKTALMEMLPLTIIPSDTTRPPREENDTNYHFVSHSDFETNIKRGVYFEQSVYAGQHYGTSIFEVTKGLNQGVGCMKAMDIKGALKAKQAFGDKCCIIYIHRPQEELVRTILQRNVPTEDKVARICSLHEEEKNMVYADYILENDRGLDDLYNQFYSLFH